MTKRVIIDERIVRIKDHNRTQLAFDELCRVGLAIEDVQCRLIECYDYSEEMAEEYIENNIEQIKTLYIIDELNPFDTIDTINNLI